MGQGGGRAGQRESGGRAPRQSDAAGVIVWDLEARFLAPSFWSTAPRLGTPAEGAAGAMQAPADEPAASPSLEVHAAECDEEGERPHTPGACGLRDAASSRAACGCCRCADKQAGFDDAARPQSWHKKALVRTLFCPLQPALAPAMLIARPASLRPSLPLRVGPAL